MSLIEIEIKIEDSNTNTNTNPTPNPNTDTPQSININIGIFMTIILVIVFFAIPTKDFSCNRSKNVCTISQKIPIIGINRSHNNYQLDTIKGVILRHNKFSERRCSGKGSTHCRNVEQYRSTLYLKTENEEAPIFTAKSSLPQYEIEKKQIEKYLNSKDNALTIKQDFKIARVILIFFIIIGLILAFSSYKQKQEI